MNNTNKLQLDSLYLMGYLINRAKELGIKGMNATKAQKLMYCCYGIY